MTSDYAMPIHPDSLLGRAIKRAGGLSTMVFSGDGLTKESVKRVDDALMEIVKEETPQ